jgi:hypothetical protein
MFLMEIYDNMIHIFLRFGHIHTLSDVIDEMVFLMTCGLTFSISFYFHHIQTCMFLTLKGNPLHINTNQRNFQHDLIQIETNFFEH